MSVIWSSWTAQGLQTLVSFFQGLSSLGVIATIFIYIHQRRAAAKAEQRQRAEALEAERRRRDAAIASEKQANRSRLTEAYMRVHATIVSSSENVELAEKLLRRGNGFVDLTRKGEMTRAIELIYLKLNAFFLEWNYRNSYPEVDMEEFYKTFDHAMRGLATNREKHFRDIVDNFAVIFADFPDDFMKIICERMNNLRSNAENMDGIRRVSLPDISV